MKTTKVCDEKYASMAQGNCRRCAWFLEAFGDVKPCTVLAANLDMTVASAAGWQPAGSLAL